MKLSFIICKEIYIKITMATSIYSQKFQNGRQSCDFFKFFTFDWKLIPKNIFKCIYCPYI